MTVNEYQNLAARTINQNQTDEQGIVNGVMGLCGESGECCDLVKKHMFQGHELNRAKLIEELGDVAWYIARTATALGVDLDGIFAGNIAKLKRRYPEGFTEERSINRPEYRTERTVSGLTEDE